ncbi:MAG TPA: hypothetical protein VHZ52_16795 [Acidobacteriaceae bacterium]|nr:hypothetical protein [Acidobacteriaceae bacterium]
MRRKQAAARIAETRRAQSVSPSALEDRAVFLNIPYDNAFRPLYLAYITGLSQFGLEPRATLEIPGGERRLDRILDLIQSCKFSIHDLSRVQLDRNPPFSTPRFNMPFELGLAVAVSKNEPRTRQWFLFETKKRRVQKSLSDMDGTDPYIHEGTVEGAMRELCNAFVRQTARPDVPQMMKAYRKLSRQVETLRMNAGADSIFTARVFKDLCLAASVLADQTRR